MRKICQECNIEKDDYKSETSNICNQCNKGNYNKRLEKYMNTDLGVDALDKKLITITKMYRKLTFAELVTYESAVELVRNGIAKVYSPNTIYVFRESKEIKDRGSVDYAIPIVNSENSIVNVFENPNFEIRDKVFDQYVLNFYGDCSVLETGVIGTAQLILGRGKAFLRSRYYRKFDNCDALYGELLCIFYALKYATTLDFPRSLHVSYKIVLHTDELGAYQAILIRRRSRNRIHNEIIKKILYLKDIVLKQKLNVDVKIDYIKDANSVLLHKLTHKEARRIIGLKKSGSRLR